jgi:hypothetical protein
MSSSSRDCKGKPLLESNLNDPNTNQTFDFPIAIVSHNYYILTLKVIATTYSVIIFSFQEVNHSLINYGHNHS